MKTTLATFCLLGLLLMAGRLEAAITLTSTDVLQVSFTTNPPFGPSTPDTIEFLNPLPGISAVGVTGYGAELFDGSTLLGTYHVNGSLPANLVPLFKSSGSATTAQNPTVVDFTKILNGTINGRMDFHLDSGTATFTNLSNAILWHATLASGAGVGSADWTTLGIQVVPSNGTAVPEPGTFAFLGVGVAILGAYRRRKR